MFKHQCDLKFSGNSLPNDISFIHLGVGFQNRWSLLVKGDHYTFFTKTH